MFIQSFKHLSKNDVAIAGGKGASLGEMTQAKIPVPPGFVVLAPAFDRFLIETDIDVEIESLMHKVNHQDVNSVDRASNEIRGIIADATFPKDIGRDIHKEFIKLKAPYVAVRSSATAEDSKLTSWAGELETYLHITTDNLLDSVKKCWSSLFTPRAIFYRFEKNLHQEKVSVAVVIQKMVDSEVSGICFTVHPVTKDRDQMIIESGWGLGEAIVGGQITPDSYVVHTKDWYILDKNISEQNIMLVRGKTGGVIEKKVPESKKEKQKVSDDMIMKLAKLFQKIADHYDHPQDIEWALVGDVIYILQSRPITTL